MKTSEKKMNPSGPNTGRTPLIAVVGNPNTGKSTLFNTLCGTRQKVGNYPGVTVERKLGRATLGDIPLEFIDLPGGYSLRADSYDEQVVVDSLMGRISGQPRPDLVLFVLDATNLERNLYLFSQIAEVGMPLVVALTMTDLLEKNGVEVDLPLLEKKLGVPVVSVPGGDKPSTERLKEVLVRSLETPPYPVEAGIFPGELEKLTDSLFAKLNRTVSLGRFEARNLIFSTRDPLNNLFKDDAEARATLELTRIRAREKGFTSPSRITVARYNWARQVVSQAESRAPDKKALFSQKLDAFLTHRVFGLLAFTGIMCLVFLSIYTWAAPLMDGIETVFSAVSDYVGAFFVNSPVLGSLITDGIIGGVGSVLVFLPQIIILFIFIAALEDSGYLARAAFLMDKLLGWTGLNGRAFIPMLSSFACAIPGVMSARVMSDPRARLTTILIAPLMSCSARLPVYILMIGAFIEPVFRAKYGASIAALISGLALFAMHGVGLLAAMPIAWVLNRKVLKTPTVPFVMELPPYRRPNLRNVYIRVSEAAKKFTVRAGTVIFALTIVIWALTFFPRPASIAAGLEAEYRGKIEALEAAGGDAAAVLDLESSRDKRIASAYLEQSYLGRTGKFIQPIFAPLGYDWKITVGLLGAFPAREVIISTLGIIYSVGDVDETSGVLRDKLRSEKYPDGRPIFTPLVALSVMVFFALCCQCMSTVITVQKELGSRKWGIFLFVYMTGLAYLAALGVFQVGRLLGFA